MSFDELFGAHPWKPIPGCPGRYSLPPSATTPSDLLGADVNAARSPAARDKVHFAALSGGGLISYERRDGTFVHTLGTADGFARKLEQLGLAG